MRVSTGSPDELPRYQRHLRRANARVNTSCLYSQVVCPSTRCAAGRPKPSVADRPESGPPPARYYARTTVLLEVACSQKRHKLNAAGVAKPIDTWTLFASSGSIAFDLVTQTQKQAVGGSTQLAFQRTGALSNLQFISFHCRSGCVTAGPDAPLFAQLTSAVRPRGLPDPPGRVLKDPQALDGPVELRLMRSGGVWRTGSTLLVLPGNASDVKPPDPARALSLCFTYGSAHIGLCRTGRPLGSAAFCWARTLDDRWALDPIGAGIRKAAATIRLWRG